MTGGTKRKYKTMTKQAKVHSHHGPERQTKILKPTDQEARITAHTAERRAIIQGMSFYLVLEILIHVHFCRLFSRTAG